MAAGDKQARKRSTQASPGFTDQEKAAAKARVRELHAATGDGTSAALAAIAAMPPADRVMAERLHALITASAPALSPKTWYGQPAYATPDGKIVCFFQPAAKFKTRYATLGFTDRAHLDAGGGLWPVAFALTTLTAAAEAQIAALVKQAVR